MQWSWLSCAAAAAAITVTTGCSEGTADCVAVYSDETFRYSDYTEDECQATCENVTFANSCYWDGSVGVGPLARAQRHLDTLAG